MVEAIRQGDIPGVQVRHRVRVPVAAAELWPWVTERQKLERWLADTVELAEGDDGGMTLATTFEGAPLAEAARTLERREGRWVLDWRRTGAGWDSGTRVELEVTEVAAGEGAPEAELSVLQVGFQRLNLTVCLTEWELYRRRWRAAFERLGGRLV